MPFILFLSTVKAENLRKTKWAQFFETPCSIQVKMWLVLIFIWFSVLNTSDACPNPFVSQNEFQLLQVFGLLAKIIWDLKSGNLEALCIVWCVYNSYVSNEKTFELLIQFSNQKLLHLQLV